MRLGDWLPAIGGAVCLGLGAGLMAVYGFFSEHLAAEFSVGMATINIGPVALILVPGLVGPFIGRLADAVPIRRLLLVGATVSMLALYGISHSPSLVVAALGFLCFALGLSMYGPVVINAMLVKLYPGHEARVLAFAAMGISAAAVVLPPLVGFLLAAMDWRSALASLAVCLATVLWLVILLAIPANPGAVVARDKRPKAPARIYRRPVFWLIGGSVALAFSVLLVLAVSYPAHFTSQGFSVSQAGVFIALSGAAGLLGKATIAALADRLRGQVKLLAVALMVSQLLGLFLLLSYGDSIGLWLGLCLLGFGGGGIIPMHPYLNSCYFDPEVIGEVTGAQMPLMLPLGLIGLPLAGYTFDQWGSFMPVFIGLAFALAMAAVLLLMLPHPNAVTSRIALGCEEVLEPKLEQATKTLP